ncbi:MAG: GNAT family N-acetyltransferase [Paraclostridium sp.]
MRKNIVYIDKNLLYVEDNNSCEYSIVDNDVEIGLASISKLALLNGVEVTDFGIHEQFRKQGYARKFFNLVQSINKEVYIEVLDINTDAYNAFTKIGFKNDSHSKTRQVYYMSLGAKPKVEVKKKEEEKAKKSEELNSLGAGSVPKQFPIYY